MSEEIEENEGGIDELIEQFDELLAEAQMDEARELIEGAISDNPDEVMLHASLAELEIELEIELGIELDEIELEPAAALEGAPGLYLLRQRVARDLQDRLLRDELRERAPADADRPLLHDVVPGVPRHGHVRAAT